MFTDSHRCSCMSMVCHACSFILSGSVGERLGRAKVVQVYVFPKIKKKRHLERLGASQFGQGKVPSFEHVVVSCGVLQSTSFRGTVTNILGLIAPRRSENKMLSLHQMAGWAGLGWAGLVVGGWWLGEL